MVSGYYRILSNQEASEVFGADYLTFVPGNPIGLIHEKEIKEKPAKKEAKGPAGKPAKKNGKRPLLKVKNSEGKVVEVAQPRQGSRPETLRLKTEGFFISKGTSFCGPLSEWQ